MRTLSNPFTLTPTSPVLSSTECFITRWKTSNFVKNTPLHVVFSTLLISQCFIWQWHCVSCLVYYLDSSTHTLPTFLLFPVSGIVTGPARRIPSSRITQKATSRFQNNKICRNICIRHRNCDCNLVQAQVVKTRWCWYGTCTKINIKLLETHFIIITCISIHPSRILQLFLNILDFHPRYKNHTIASTVSTVLTWEEVRMVNNALSVDCMSWPSLSFHTIHDKSLSTGSVLWKPVA